MWMLPVVGMSRPAIIDKSVLLPQPDGPTRMRNSPASTSMSMPLRMSTAPKLLRTLRIDSAPMICCPFACSTVRAEVSKPSRVDAWLRYLSPNGIACARPGQPALAIPALANPFGLRYRRLHRVDARLRYLRPHRIDLSPNGTACARPAQPCFGPSARPDR